MQFIKINKKQKRCINDFLVGYLFASPVILGILIFTLVPTLFAFVSSFFDVNMGELVFRNFGFQNYTSIFTDENKSFMFFQSLKVTFLYSAINIPLTLVLSFSLALFLNQRLKGMNFFRVLYYLPVLIPSVCSGLIWQNITQRYNGILNNILVSINLPRYDWMTQYHSAMPSLIFIGLFGLGGSMILWLAQLKNVSESLYEGARIEGASYLTQLFRITIPMCTPMIFYNLVLGIIATLQTFTSVMVITTGAGPSYSLLFYLINVYSYIQGHDLGFASSLSFILMLIIAIFTFIVFKTGGWVYYGEDN